MIRETVTDMIETIFGRGTVAELAQRKDAERLSDRQSLVLEIRKAQAAVDAAQRSWQRKVAAAREAHEAAVSVAMQKRAELTAVESEAGAVYALESRAGVLQQALRAIPSPRIDAGRALLEKLRQETQNRVCLTPYLMGEGRPYVTTTFDACAERGAALRAALERLDAACLEALDDQQVDTLVATLVDALPPVYADEPVWNARRKGVALAGSLRYLTSEIEARIIADGTVTDRKSFSVRNAAIAWVDQRYQQVLVEIERAADDRNLEHKKAELRVRDVVTVGRPARA